MWTAVRERSRWTPGRQRGRRRRLTAAKLHTGDGSIVYRAESGTSMSGHWEVTTVTAPVNSPAAASCQWGGDGGEKRLELVVLDCGTGRCRHLNGGRAGAAPPRSGSRTYLLETCNSGPSVGHLTVLWVQRPRETWFQSEA